MILERFAVWLVSKIPPPLLRDTERIGLSLGFMVVGILSAAALISPSVPTHSPEWVIIEWAVTLTLGGGLTVWGIWRSLRLVERLGMMLAGIGCFTYGLTLVASGADGNLRRVFIGVLFLIFAVIKAIRLAASTAAASLIRDKGEL